MEEQINFTAFSVKLHISDVGMLDWIGLDWCVIDKQATLDCLLVWFLALAWCGVHDQDGRLNCVVLY